MGAAAEPLSLMIDRVYRSFGEAAVYTDRDAVAHDVTLVIDRALSHYGTVAQVNGKTAVVCVRTSEVEGAPRRGETFTVAGGQVLTVDSLISADEFEHRVLVA